MVAMGEFKDMLKARRKSERAKTDYDTLGKAIKDRGNRTFKAPYFSDRKTGELMIDKKNLSKRIRRLGKVYKGRRNRLIGGVAGKTLLLGAAAYGAKTLVDDYDSRTEKYASYPGRVAESFGRLVNLARKSNEVKASSQKAVRGITKELKKPKPNKNKLGHLNAKKVKEARTAKEKRQLELTAKLTGPAVVVGSGLYLKKKYDDSHPARLTSYYR